MNIAIWGAGVYGRDLLSYLKDYELHNGIASSVLTNVCCFLDNAASDSTIEGIPVFKPIDESIKSIDIVIVAVKKYRDIIQQIRTMQHSLKICIYNPKYKLRFMCELRKCLPGHQYPKYFCRIEEKMDSLAKVMEQCKEQDIAAWRNLIGAMCKENFLAAVEETGDAELGTYLYENLFAGYKPFRKIKTIGIYYYRFYNGGVERVISQLMPIFLQLGFRVVLITSEINPEKEYPCPGDVIRAVISRKSLDSFERYRKIRELVDEYEIDLMHLHGCYDYDVTSMIVPFLRMHGIYTFLHIHNFYQNIKNRDSLLYSYRLADKVVVLSRADEAFWQSQGVSATYIPNPVNLDIDYMYHAKESTRPTIVWVGRIEEEQKQVCETVRIMRELVKNIPSALLKIIGKADNPQVMEKLKKMISEEKLEKNIHLCGFRQDPWQECRDADVFLLTSSYEGFSMVLMESKMVGLPAVIYSLPYLELLREKRGYLETDQSNAAGAAKLIENLLQDKKLQQRLSEEARASIENFATVNTAENWRGLIMEAVQGVE